VRERKMKVKTIIVCTEDEGLKDLLKNIFTPLYHLIFYTDCGNIAYKAVESKAVKVIIDISGNPAEMEEEIQKLKAEHSLLGLHVILLSSDKNIQNVLNYGNGYKLFKGKTGSALELFRNIKENLEVTAEKYKH
jgi:rRNA-processing protein FCF1